MNRRFFRRMRRSLEAAGGYIDAQQAYVEAVEQGWPEAELKRLAEAALAAADRYDVEMRDLLESVRAMDPGPERDAYVEQTEELLVHLSAAKTTFAEMVEHHTRKITQ